MPTKAPTGVPTSAPVVAPTEPPVVVSTIAPVVAPTYTPIVSPTKAPVVDSTKSPVISPTSSPTTKPCGVIGFEMWDATSNEPLFPIEDGDVFCSGDLPLYVSIEAIAEPCVDYVRLQLASEDEVVAARTEGAAPYMLAGDRGGVDIHPMELPPAEYELMAFPDGHRSLTKDISFTISQCFEFESRRV